MPISTNHAMNPVSPHVGVKYRLFGNINLKELTVALLKYIA
jgi:hypothetical protein